MKAILEKYHELGKRLINFVAMGIIGLTILTITAVLIVIAIWPPFDTLSFFLPLGFITGIACIVFFVRSTDGKHETGTAGDLKTE